MAKLLLFAIIINCATCQYLGFAEMKDKIEEIELKFEEDLAKHIEMAEEKDSQIKLNMRNLMEITNNSNVENCTTIENIEKKIDQLIKRVDRLEISKPIASTIKTPKLVLGNFVKLQELGQRLDALEVINAQEHLSTQLELDGVKIDVKTNQETIESLKQQFKNESLESYDALYNN
jgi:hypothetical protein